MGCLACPVQGTRSNPMTWNNRGLFAAEKAGASRTKDDDEYPGKPRLFWVRHGHYRGLTYSRQNSKSSKFLTASEILPVTMGRTRTIREAEEASRKAIQ